MPYIIIFIILTILIFNLIVFLIKLKIKKLETKIINLFKKRNYQIISIYIISEIYVSRHKDIFRDFLELKRKDFSENTYNISLEDKIITYKKIHNEINFIFKICDKNNKLFKNEFYNYIKESIIEKSGEIGENYDLYSKIIKNYKNYSTISKFTIVGILMGN